MHDMSMLAPMSVKDVIWIERERYNASVENNKETENKYKFAIERFEDLQLLLLDIREVSRNTNVFVKLAALKDSKRPPRIKPIKVEDLPSEIVSRRKRKIQKQKEEQQKKAADIQREENDLVARCVAALAKEKERERSKKAKQVMAPKHNSDVPLVDQVKT